MEDENSIINFSIIREQKQEQADNGIIQFYEEFINFVKKYANIREKVRASYVFREKIGFSHDRELPAHLEETFYEWFAFDYVTVRGKTMLHFFLDEHKKKRSEPFLIQLALFLPSVWEPICVSKVPDSFFLKGYNPLTNESVIIKDVRGRFTEVKQNEILWVRKIKSIGYDVLISSRLLYFDYTTYGMNELQAHFNRVQMKLDKPSWRTFFKMHAIEYVVNGDTKREDD
ncbi:nicotinate phosphoribosyltransferase [Bacillus sp. CGMCC 1.16541]|uniref:nicotinate phosphoribosyltransferase n=1 Tax=Bacillus sp. CGMCC 1.16541 TaxID=2185143 RepID=UPI000D725E4E|nr:nicotinate phosphoribosyltransferase [Bacillus sp. CGMCC 1.16541]